MSCRLDCLRPGQEEFVGPWPPLLEELKVAVLVQLTERGEKLALRVQKNVAVVLESMRLCGLGRESPSEGCHGIRNGFGLGLVWREELGPGAHLNE